VAVEENGKYILTSSPRQDTYFRVWLAYASVNWRDWHGWHFREFNHGGITFRTKGEAEDFGFRVARSWVRKSTVAKQRLRHYMESRRDQV
jgi:hypothetical protein